MSLKDKEQEWFFLLPNKEASECTIKGYKSKDVKKAVLEYEQLINNFFKTDEVVSNEDDYKEKETELYLIRQLKTTFGDFE